MYFRKLLNTTSISFTFCPEDAIWVFDYFNILILLRLNYDTVTQRNRPQTIGWPCWQARPSFQAINYWISSFSERHGIPSGWFTHLCPRGKRFSSAGQHQQVEFEFQRVSSSQPSVDECPLGSFRLILPRGPWLVCARELHYQTIVQPKDRAAYQSFSRG